MQWEEASSPEVANSTFRCCQRLISFLSKQDSPIRLRQHFPGCSPRSIHLRPNEAFQTQNQRLMTESTRDEHWKLFIETVSSFPADLNFDSRVQRNSFLFYWIKFFFRRIFRLFLLTEMLFAVLLFSICLSSTSMSLVLLLGALLLYCLRFWCRLCALNTN